MATTVVSTLTDIRRTFIAEAELINEWAPVTPKLFRARNLPKKQGTTYNLPYLSNVTATDLTDGVEFDSPDNPTDTNVQFTPAEVGVQVLWTNRLNMVITEDFPRIAASMMTNAINYKRDRDGIAQFDNFAGIMGAAGTAVHHGLLASGVTNVRTGRFEGATSGTPVQRTGTRATGDPPKGQKINIVMHPYNFYDLAVQYGGLANVTAGTNSVAVGTAQSSIGAGPGVGEYERRWREEYDTGIRIQGAGVYLDGNMTIDANADIKGCIASEEALQHITFQGIQDYQVRTSDGRAVRHTVWCDYAWGEYVDQWGRELFIDATAPTG